MKMVDVYYRVRTKADGWLPEVKNLEDYAGFTGAVTDAAIRVSAGSVKYRVHIKGGKWLPLRHRLQHQRRDKRLRWQRFGD